ncbi:MAG TPA: 4Fe-4S dicluster domain-containing protein, partial [Planctomycetota bacterium]|nr:4Fe-4S dicluster domain-containing protein [Planctomycetota bacterium]
MHARELVDYAASLDCIHCGLCLRTCPTYRLSGAESSSPRGRIHLMRAVAEGRLDAREPGYGEELDFCLVCRHCESVCPAGVRFGEMMEFARDALEREQPRPWFGRFVRFLGFDRVLVRRGSLQLAFGALRLAQRTGLVQLAAKLGGARGRALAALPSVPPARERRLLPAVTPAEGERQGAVALLEGCVMPELYGRVQRATARVLAAAGWEVRTAAGHVCCGALHAHNGRLEGARREARDTIAHFERLTDERGEPSPLVNASAGCGAHLKAYGHLLADDPEWAGRARALAARTLDLSQLLARNPAALRGRLRARADAGTLAYADPCHLCHGQGVRREPRDRLDLVEGLRR